MDWSGTFAWARRHWRPLAVIVSMILVALNAQAVGLAILWLADRIIGYVVVPVLLLAAVVWGLLRASGYGSLWGKKKD